MVILKFEFDVMGGLLHRRGTSDDAHGVEALLGKDKTGITASAAVIGHAAGESDDAFWGGRRRGNEVGHGQ